MTLGRTEPIPSGLLRETCAKKTLRGEPSRYFVDVALADPAITVTEDRPILRSYPCWG